MPVGAGLVIATDDGLAIPVVVVRVHEQVAGAEMPPGMRVQAEGWRVRRPAGGRALVSREDPEIPELPVAPRGADAARRPSKLPRSRAGGDRIVRGGRAAHDTTVMDVPELAAVAGRRRGDGARRGPGERQRRRGPARRSRPLRRPAAPWSSAPPRSRRSPARFRSDDEHEGRREHRAPPPAQRRHRHRQRRARRQRRRAARQVPRQAQARQEALAAPSGSAIGVAKCAKFAKCIDPVAAAV